MDQISNMLNAIKTGGMVRKKTITVPYSGVKERILECLKKEGFVSGYEKKTLKNHPTIEVEVLYVDGRPKIKDFKRVSKLSKRVYMSAKEIRPIMAGRGILVLSTPKGVLSGKVAKKENVGGEALFQLM
ncbi:30S ribosomal protein S8 [Candidatus Nomurabacteria bacterium]|nr:30S ribosomal protein S8 [Candidatus Nomurabacteria bacterium]USN94785.1 MAG: 30S ribosomal protein S8 [Candidatus Nomurabacteria bacterium]